MHNKWVWPKYFLKILVRERGTWYCVETQFDNM